MTDGPSSLDEPARDFRGYGPTPPHARWPGNARIAVNFNLNFEAGGERSVVDGDAASESLLTDIGAPAYEGRRSPLVESAFEYGPRVGLWRLLRLFRDFDVRVSVLAVARALERCPEALAAFLDDGHEIVSHGWRWLDYHLVDRDTEREHIRLALDRLTALTGERPVGWMTGRPGPNTRSLLVEAGVLYDRDSLADELPYWTRVGGRNHLVIPYSFETNDNRFDQNHGFSTAADCAEYFIDCFDMLYAEGAECPKIMSIGLHDRLIGRPARAKALIQFLEYVRSHDRVWFCTGRDIAEHWLKVHPVPVTL